MAVCISLVLQSGFGKKRQSDADGIMIHLILVFTVEYFVPSSFLAPQVRKKGRRVVSDDEDSDE